jgi:hypothetical protein
MVGQLNVFSSFKNNISNQNNVPSCPNPSKKNSKFLKNKNSKDSNHGQIVMHYFPF